MNCIRVADGTEFEVIWVAVASIDGALRFAVVNPNAAQLFATFTNPENCSLITRVIDGKDMETFVGYRVFRSINMTYDGNAVIALSKI